MKMEVRGTVDYTEAALKAVLKLAYGSDNMSGEVQDILMRCNEYRNGEMIIQNRDGARGMPYTGQLNVTFTGPEENASRLGRYFDDVSRFSGSHLAMMAARRSKNRLM